ncbi:MAG: FtsW/RodA/SpoVE family cell cycle protein [Verrucomicrobiales bacterium]
MARHAGHILIAVVLALIGLGVVMLVSTGTWSNDARVDAYFSVKRQFAWLGVSVVSCFLMSRLPYHWWRKTAPWFYALVCMLLVACFIPQVGERINGSARWVSGKHFNLAFLHLQPSELAKLAIVFGLAAWYVRMDKDSCRFLPGFVAPLLIVLPPLALIAAEVDIGAASLIALSAFGIMFAAGANLFATFVTLLGGLGALWAGIKFIPNRTRRFTDFLDVLSNPLDHLQDTGMQQVRAMMAFASGGVQGVGLGSGQQKIQGLPYAHTDFIFPMIGEELGLWATLLVVFCYGLLLVCGMSISLHAPDRFGKLAGVGVVLVISLQAILNIAVTTVCLPNKGLPLPFVSYGGSNLVCCLLGVGLLLNLHRHGVFPKRERPAGMPTGRITPRV